MRNLKRALSLTLASIMLLGMMVVGSSAAGFPDVTEENNVEAIEVLQAIEVMVGDDNGNFGPNDPVNRSQMAVVMAKLLNLDYEYYEASCPFWDVPTWARPYVGACYANKIVSGYGDGTYGAADTVTAVQAASMMMRALGYFKYSEDYKDGFETSTVRQGTEIGIFKGVGSSATAPMTRNQVAKMALNALQSEMVIFTGTPGTTYTASSGETLSIGYVPKYEPRTSTETKYQAIEKRTSDVQNDTNVNRGQYYIQLGEELFDGKLTRRYARDDFMRPSINWQYKGKDIGTYVDYDLLVANGTFYEGVKFSALYDLLTYTTINENDILRFEDGVDRAISRSDFSRSNKNEVGGKGALTEVFLDQERDEIIITTINTYLAKANSDYNKGNESLSLNVYVSSTKGSSTASNVTTGGSVTGITKIVDSKEVAEAADVTKDEYALVYMSGKDQDAKFETYSQYDVVAMFVPEIISDTAISKYSIDGNANGKKVAGELTVNGTVYKTNCKAYYDYGEVLDEYDTQLLSGMSYNLYMDRYGNVIGVDLYEGTRNYVFITGYDRGDSHISVKTADAAAIFTDGTMDTITVNVTDTNKNIDNAKKRDTTGYLEYEEWGLQTPKDNRAGDKNLNRWYTYTVGSNGAYTLKPIKNFIYTSYTADYLNTLEDDTKVLNTANLFLDDSSKINSDNKAGKGRVYGEDASIYITVEPGSVDKSETPDTKDAITKVDSVYTGAQDVKLKLNADTKLLVNNDKEMDDAANGKRAAQETIEEQNAYVYSIFDNNGYIIASVVLGEAQGGSANYVYVLGGAKNERVEHAGSSRDASTDTYYWEFEAVVNGEKTTLTVKEKYQDTLKSNLAVHMVQEIRYDGEYVVDIQDVKLKEIFHKNSDENTIDDKDVYDVGNVAGSGWKDNDHGVMDNTEDNKGLKDEKGNALYTEADRVKGDIYLQGRTLYVKNEAGKKDVGLALSRDAKAVLIQPENGKREVTNCGSVSEALGRLGDYNENEPDTQFKGRIVGVLNNAGQAQWVVIISDTNLKTGSIPNYNNWTSYRDFGNIRLHVWNISTKNVSAWIDNDGYLRVTLPQFSKAAVNDKYDVDVYINNAYVGRAVFEEKAETLTTVTYVLETTKVSYNSNLNIDVYASAKTDDGDKNPVVTIDEANITGGKVTFTPANPKAGETVTLVGTPTNAGEVPTYTVTDGNGNKVDVNEKGEFTMPASGVTVKATFGPKQPTKYTVKIDSANVTGGTVTADVEKAAKDDIVTLTGAPATAGEVPTFTVKGEDGTVIPVSADGKFTMPAQNVVVTAVFSDKSQKGSLTISITGAEAADLVLTDKAGTEVPYTSGTAISVDKGAYTLTSKLTGKKVTVDGATPVSGKTDQWTITVGETAVTVTVAVTDAQKITIRSSIRKSWPAYVLGADGKPVTEVTPGQKVKVDPPKALKLTGDVSEPVNGVYTVNDDAKTVKLELNDGWFFNAAMGIWGDENDAEAFDYNRYDPEEDAAMLGRAAVVAGNEPQKISKGWVGKAIRAAAKTTKCVTIQEGDCGWYIVVNDDLRIKRYPSTQKSIWATATENTTYKTGTGWFGEMDVYADVDADNKITTVEVLSRLGTAIPGTVPAVEFDLTNEAGDKTTASVELSDNGDDTYGLTIAPAENVAFTASSEVDGNPVDMDEDVDGSGVYTVNEVEVLTPDENIEAVVSLGANNSFSAEFFEYDPDSKAVDALDAKQIAAALNRDNTYNLKFTSDKVDLSEAGNETATAVTGDVVALTLTQGKATQVYKVTYPGPNGSVTVKVDGNGVDRGTEVHKDIKALLPSNVITDEANNAINVEADQEDQTKMVTGGAMTPVANTADGSDAAEKMDTTYVAAVALPGGAQGTNAGLVDDGVLRVEIVAETNSNKAVLVAKYVDANGMLKPITESNVIQVGTKLYFTAGADIGDFKGESIGVKINGETEPSLTLSVAKDGSLSNKGKEMNDEFSVTIPNKYPGQGTNIAIEPVVVEANTGDAKYFVGTEELTEKTDGGWYKIENMEGYVLAYEDPQNEGSYIAIRSTSYEYNSVTKVGVLNPAGNHGATADENNEIHLYKAYTVIGANDNDGTTWKVWKNWDNNTNEGKDAIDTQAAEVFVPGAEQTYVYVEATDPGMILTWADGTVLSSVIQRNLGASVLAGDNLTSIVWKVPVNRSIEAEDIVNALTIGQTTAAAITKDVEADKMVTDIQVTGIDVGKGVTVESAVLKNLTDGEYTDVVFSETAAKVGEGTEGNITFSFKSNKAHTDGGNNGTDANFANLLLTVKSGKVQFNVPVTVTVRNAAAASNPGEGADDGGN